MEFIEVFKIETNTEYNYRSQFLVCADDLVLACEKLRAFLSKEGESFDFRDIDNVTRVKKVLC